MNAIIQIQIRNVDQSTCRNDDICRAQHTVNIQLHRTVIQAGSIELGSVLISLRLQGDGVGSDRLTGNLLAFIIVTDDTHTCEIGVFAVNGCIRIINRDVIYIVGNILIIVVASLASGVMAVDLEIFKGFIGIQHGPAEIEPSAIFNTGVGSHHICYFRVYGSRATIFFQETCTKLHRVRNNLCRNVHPEANTDRIGQIKGFRQEYIHLTMAGCGHIGPVNINSHGIVAVSNFAIIPVYQVHLGRNIQANRSIVFL